MANKCVLVLDGTRYRAAMAGDTLCDGTGNPVGGGGVAGNMDGGQPDSQYGGIPAIDGGVP